MKIGEIYQQIIGCALFSIKDFRNRIELESFKASSHVYDFSVVVSSPFRFHLCYKLNCFNHLCPLVQMNFISESLWTTVPASKETPNFYIWYLLIIQNHRQTSIWWIVKLVSITPRNLFCLFSSPKDIPFNFFQYSKFSCFSFHHLAFTIHVNYW